MKFDFEIDTAWCLEQLFKDGKITDRDRMLVQTTHRQREQLKWHPLQWIANFNLSTTGILTSSRAGTIRLTANATTTMIIAGLCPVASGTYPQAHSSLISPPDGTLTPLP